MRTLSVAVAAVCLALGAAAAGAQETAQASEARPFDFADVQAEAERLAREPYRKPASMPAGELRRIDYDQHQRIRFRREHALWPNSKAFKVELFPAGFIFEQPVAINVVSGGRAQPVQPKAEMFDFSGSWLREQPKDVAFAGFRVLTPLHQPDKLDEVASFLGASYFRIIGREQAYGLSARGLAIDTGLPRPEEFPAFRTFWLVEPRPDDRTATIYALLDSPGAAGAYRFVVRPGTRTVVDATATLFVRHDITLLGLAPLTSMFFTGKTARGRVADYRPEVHDSDGLLIATGAGERIWRPLTNFPTLAISSFLDRNPRGFGLLQRERDFAQYQDTQAHYHRRPSFWVEPQGDWGEGEVRLIEIPTDSEMHDNVVAFWAPKGPAPKGRRIDLAYRLVALADEWTLSPAARVVSTRGSAGDNAKVRRLVVDFAGGDLEVLRPEQPVKAEVSAAGGKLINARVEALAQARRWRLTIDVEPDGKKPMDLRAYLSMDGEALSETWTYTVRP